MELDVFFVRENVMGKSLFVSHIPATEQVTNILTMALSQSQFHVLHDKLSVFLQNTLSLWEEC